jgi:YgiT-type zinc finger domain-containing protein
MSQTQTTCDLCGKDGARLRRMTRAYGRGKSELIIRDVPVISCPHCGETHLAAETRRVIQKIKAGREDFATQRPVRVAKFKCVA